MLFHWDFHTKNYHFCFAGFSQSNLVGVKFNYFSRIILITAWAKKPIVSSTKYDCESIIDWQGKKYVVKWSFRVIYFTSSIYKTETLCSEGSTLLWSQHCLKTTTNAKYWRLSSQDASYPARTSVGRQPLLVISWTQSYSLFSLSYHSF